MIQEPIPRLGPELFILLATHPIIVAKNTSKVDLGLISPPGAVVPRRNPNDSSHKVPIRNKGASARKDFPTSEPIPARVPHGEEWIRLKSATHFSLVTLMVRRGRWCEKNSRRKLKSGDLFKRGFTTVRIIYFGFSSYLKNCPG